MRVALVLGLVLLAGCLEEGAEDGGAPAPDEPMGSSTPASSATPTPTPPSSEPTNVSFRVLGEGQQEGPESVERAAYDTEAEWAAASQRYPETESPDLASETVVAVAAGQRPNGCWGIAVTGAQKQPDGQVVVEVTTYAPPPDAFCIDVVTYPWQVVALEGKHADVAFVERTATYGS